MPPQDNQDQNTNVNPQPSFGGDQPVVPATPAPSDVSSPQPSAPSFDAPASADNSVSQPDVGSDSTPVEPVVPTEPEVSDFSASPIEPVTPAVDTPAPVEPVVPTEPVAPEAGTNDDQNNQPFVSQ